MSGDGDGDTGTGDGNDSGHGELVETAADQLDAATTIVSDFAVGAAVRTPDGSVYAGSNHESERIDETVHAEESAVACALENGHETIEAVAVVTAAGDKAAPCGMCRQTLVEVGGEDATVVCAPPDGGGADIYRLGALVPEAFVGAEVGQHESKDGTPSHPEATGEPVDTDLVDHASEARAAATATYTRRNAGAAVRTPDGTVYTGSDHEFANFTNTIPAEEVAVVRALEHGHEAVESVAVVADGREHAVPSGGAREFLAEYADGDGPVLVAAPDGEGVDVVGLPELLPGRAGTGSVEAEVEVEGDRDGTRTDTENEDGPGTERTDGGSGVPR